MLSEAKVRLGNLRIDRLTWQRSMQKVERAAITHFARDLALARSPTFSTAIVLTSSSALECEKATTIYQKCFSFASITYSVVQLCEGSSTTHVDPLEGDRGHPQSTGR